MVVLGCVVINKVGGFIQASRTRRRPGTVFDVHGLHPQLFEALARFGVVRG